MKCSHVKENGSLSSKYFHAAYKTHPNKPMINSFMFINMANCEKMLSKK